MGVYDSAIALAKRLIAAKGGECKVRALAQVDPDPWGPGTGAATDYPTMGVLFDYNMQQAGQIKAAGQTYETGDKQCYLEAADLALAEVTTAHWLVDPAGKVWKIRSVKKLAPDGVSTILWELHLGV